MTTPDRPSSYDESPSWQHYRALLESEFHLRLAHHPNETWRDLAGHQVHVDDWLPEGKAADTLILVHGGGGNGRVLAPFADIAVSAGWRVLAPDLPGYGLTKPSPQFDWDYREWPEIVAALADATDGIVALMGLSVGGTTAVLAAAKTRGVAGVLVTTLLDMRQPATFARAARWPWLGAFSLVGFRALPRVVDRIRLPLRLAAPMASMSSRAAMQRYFQTDPLLGGLSVPSRFFRTLHQHPPLTALRVPLRLVHPGADAWTPAALSQSTLARYGGPTSFRLLSNGAHLPLEMPAFAELRQELTGFLGSLT